MRAIVLAAGEGSRLQPLTRSKPKVMVGVANRPIIAHVLDALVGNGITDVTVVVGYRRERVQSYLGDGNRFGCDITYAFQESLLGTAHALSRVDFQDEEVVVLGGDNLVDEKLVAQALTGGSGVRLVAHRSDNPSKYGVLTLEGDRVVDIQEKPPTHTSEFVNTGVYRFPPGFQEVLREGVRDGLTGLTHLLQERVVPKETVHAVRSDALWMDAVYPWDLPGITAHLLPHRDGGQVAESATVHPTAVVEGIVGEDAHVGPHALVRSGTTVGRNVTLGAGTILEASILYDDVQVGPGTVLQRSVVDEGARLGARTTALSGACTVRASDGFHDLDLFGAVVGEDAHVGGGTVLHPGTIVGNRATVDAGARARGTIPDDARVM